MYEEERLKKICKYVQNQTRISIHSLCDIFHISESTARRDLTELERRKLLKRTHGGAVCTSAVGIEPSYREKCDKYHQEKQKIAACAAKQIENGDSLLIDSGTTTMCLAPYLCKFEKLTVVTNSIFLMQKLSWYSNITLICVGGTLRSNTIALVGPVAEENLSHIRVDKAFMATNGIDAEAGLTTPNLAEASVKSRMIASSKQVYVLADHSKIGHISFASFGKLADVEVCITCHPILDEQQQKIKNKGVRFYFADSQDYTY